MSDEIKHMCKTCDYWHGDALNDYPKKSCNRHPPKLSHPDTPSTSGNYGCGEHSAIREGQSGETEKESFYDSLYTECLLCVAGVTDHGAKRSKPVKTGPEFFSSCPNDCKYNPLKEKAQ